MKHKRDLKTLFIGVTVIKLVLKFLNIYLAIGILCVFNGFMAVDSEEVWMWSDLLTTGHSAKFLGLLQILVGLILIIGGIKIGINKIRKLNETNYKTKKGE